MPSRRDKTRRHGGADIQQPTASVRLTRKYADMIDGVDLREAKVGDRLNLPVHAAEVLVAEGWAVKIRATAADGSTRRKPRAQR
jgi:hypothetical protein